MAMLHLTLATAAIAATLALFGPNDRPLNQREEAKAMAIEAMRFGYVCALRGVTAEKCAVELKVMLDSVDRRTR